MSRKVADTMEVGGSGLRNWRSSYLVLGRLLPSGPFDDRFEPSRVVDHPAHDHASAAGHKERCRARETGRPGVSHEVASLGKSWNVLHENGRE